MKRVKPLRNVAAAQSVLVVERELFGPFFLTTKKQSPSFLNLHPESIVFTTNKYSTAECRLKFMEETFINDTTTSFNSRSILLYS